MKELIHTEDQKFHHSTLNQLEDYKFQEPNNCLIINENDLTRLLENNRNLIGGNVSQVVVIGDDMGKFVDPLKAKKVLLIAASSFEEAVFLATNGLPIIDKVICITDKEDGTHAQETVESVLHHGIIL